MCVCPRLCESLRTDSSQSDSMSDAEEARPSFSRPLQSQESDGQADADADAANKFAMYNSVSQKLMVKHSSCKHAQTKHDPQAVQCFSANLVMSSRQHIDTDMMHSVLHP